jgi:L-ascorbate metabolism protein UlaG (beta-lactamase superfamily)
MGRSPGWIRAGVLSFAMAAAGGACHHTPYLAEASSVASADAGLTVRWFGTSTVTVSDDSKTLMVDGFFSRLGKPRLVLAWTGLPLVRQDQRQLDWARTALEDQPVHALFVAHSHHDHALDAAYMASWKKSVLYGSKSTNAVVEGILDSEATPTVDGRPLKVAPGFRRETIHVGQSICVGQFKVTILDSPHKPSTFGPAGEVEPPFRMPTGLRKFRSGPSYAFYVEHPKGRILIIPSAVLPPDDPPRYPAADVVLLGIGMLGRAPPESAIRYWNAAVDPVHTKRVHPIHWDDFTVPLSVEMRPFPLDRVDRSIELLRALARPEQELSYLPLATRVRLPVYAGPAAQELGCPSPMQQPPG